MFAQLLCIAVLVYVPAAVLLLWRRDRERYRPEAQERSAQSALRATVRSGNVTAAPVEPPVASVHPLWPRLVDDDEPRSAA